MWYEYMVIYEFMISGVGLECLIDYNDNVLKYEGWSIGFAMM